MESKERTMFDKSSILQDPLGLMLDGDDPLSLFQKQAAENFEDKDDVNGITKIRFINHFVSTLTTILSILVVIC